MNHPFVDHAGVPYERDTKVRGSLEPGNYFNGVVKGWLIPGDPRNTTASHALLVLCDDGEFRVFPVPQVNRA